MSIAFVIGFQNGNKIGQDTSMLVEWFSQGTQASVNRKRTLGKRNRQTIITQFSIYDHLEIFILSQPLKIVIIPYYNLLFAGSFWPLSVSQFILLLSLIFSSPNYFLSIKLLQVATISAICSAIKSILFFDPTQLQLMVRSVDWRKITHNYENFFLKYSLPVTW